jgi:hypothetical protein
MPREISAPATPLALVALVGLACVVACDDPPSAPSPPASASLAVVYEQQAGKYLCWAASAVMVVKTLQYNAVQCQVCELGAGEKACCGPSVPPPDCDQPGWPPFCKLGFKHKRTTYAALTLDQLMQEIGVARRPVAASWEWTDENGGRSGAGHMFVVGGYDTAGAEPTLEIYDPLCDENPPPDPSRPCAYRLIPYSEYGSGVLANNTAYLHWDDFHAIQHK